MADNTLTLALDGDVSLQQFAEAILRFRNLVDLLSREIAPNVQIEWLIDDLQVGSAIATIVGLSSEEEDIIKIVRGYGKIGESLERREPIPFSESVVREAKAITKIVNDKILSVRFMTAETDAIIYGAFDNQKSVSLARRVSFGLVKGRVQALSSRGNLKFTLYDSTFDKGVSCYLHEGQENLMREIWGKNVIVTGRVTRQPDSGQAISVRDITSIDSVIEVEPDSYKVARGILNWAEGDEPAEISIRRLRDAED